MIKIKDKDVDKFMEKEEFVKITIGRFESIIRISEIITEQLKDMMEELLKWEKKI